MTNFNLRSLLQVYISDKTSRSLGATKHCLFSFCIVLSAQTKNEVTVRDDGLFSAMTASKNSASGSSYFMGSTSSGDEAAWFGYKNNSYGVANCILLIGYYPSNLRIYHAIYDGDAWHVYYI